MDVYLTITIIIIKRNKPWIRVIEWLLFNVNTATFQLYHGENKF